MFKSFIKITIVIVLMMHFISGSSAADTSSYNFSFSETNSNIAMPRFDLSLGTLNSVTYSIDNMRLNSTIIFDLDSSSGSLLLENVFAGHNVGVGPIGSPIYASLFGIQGPVNGSFMSYEDGDGIGTHNGGNDEIISPFGFFISSSSKSFTDSGHLDALSGSTSPVAFVGPIMNIAAIPIKLGDPPRTIETYFEDITYSGNFTVSYDYTPVAPEPISSILFVTGGATLAGKRYLKKKRRT